MAISYWAHGAKDATGLRNDGAPSNSYTTYNSPINAHQSYNKMLTQIDPFGTIFVAKHTGWSHNPDEESSSELEPEVIIQFFQIYRSKLTALQTGLDVNKKKDASQHPPRKT